MHRTLPSPNVARRRLLLAAAIGTVVGAAHSGETAASAPRVAGNRWPQAFAADRVDRAIELLSDDQRTAGAAGLLQAPELFEDGAFVPVTIGSVATPSSRLALLVDRNPTPLVAVFDVVGPVDAAFDVRVKMAETSAVRVLAWPAVGAAPSETRKTVKVVQGGCGDEPIPDDVAAAHQLGAMHIRAQRSVGRSGAVVRVLMHHPMETGLRKDASGHLVAAWFIDHVEASLNGRQLFTAVWGNAIAANPYLQFTLPSAEPGDRVQLGWVDTRGGRREGVAVVA